ncbi:MAG: T9SS type A sorting domain-containing protein [Bacteroidota bacterium]
MKKTITFIISLTVAAITAHAQSGSLDNTFGTGGKITTPVGSATDVGTSAAIQSDGKIVVAGRSNNGANDDFAVARYNNTIGTGIGTISRQSTEIKIYPNPASSIVRVDGEENIISIKVLNLLSQVMINENNQNNFDVSKLENGIYFVEVVTTKGVATKKLIVN